MAKTNLKKKRKKISSEMWVAGSAIFMSLCALFISIYEVNILQKQYDAQIWPHVARYVHRGNKEYNIHIHNKGVGPAIVNSVVVKYKGEIVRTWYQLLKKIFPRLKLNYLCSTFNTKVLAPDESNIIFGFESEDATILSQLKQSMQDLDITYIYSSIQGQHWEVLHNKKPKRISSFKFIKEEQFLQ